MTGIAEYASLDGTEMARLIAKGELKPAELLEEAIRRCEEVNGEINAVVLKHYEEARKEVKSPLAKGAFSGVPYLLKDLHVAMTGTETSFGSRAFKGWMAEEDNFYTQRCREAGLVIFGKTNSPELGLTVTTEPALYGPSRNPWDTNRSTGGSSGGAGAAVAAGIVPMAHASDGGGSIRLPAAHCGLVGLKPTRGRVSIGPSRGEGWAGMSINHAVTHTVRDSAGLLDCFAGWTQGDPYDAPTPARPFIEEVGAEVGRLKIAFNVARPDGSAASPEITQAVKQTAAMCEALGHEMVEDKPELDLAEIGANQVKIIGANVALALRERGEVLGRAVREDEVEAVTWDMAQRGRAVSAEDYIAGVNFVHALGRKLARFHEDYDLYLTPVYTEKPFPIGLVNMQTDDIPSYGALMARLVPYTGLANMTGQPAISLPLQQSDDGLPLGMMFTARFGDEAMLVRLAAQMEQSHPWRDRRPPVFAA